MCICDIYIYIYAYVHVSVYITYKCKAFKRKLDVCIGLLLVIP